MATPAESVTGICCTVAADIFGASAVAARYNEGKAIDAVLRQIEAREKLPRLDDGRSPDDLHDADPERRVDYACTVGKQLYAFEHTGIEPFENQIEMEVHNANLFRPIIERFDNRTSDAEYWELMYPVEAAIGLGGAKIKQVQRALIDWICPRADAGVPAPGHRHQRRFRSGSCGHAPRP
jgi:hypothetical protein